MKCAEITVLEKETVFQIPAWGVAASETTPRVHLWLIEPHGLLCFLRLWQSWKRPLGLVDADTNKCAFFLNR